MKFPPILSFVLLIFALQGCYTTHNFSTINIELIEPGKVHFSPECRTAGVLYNNSNYKLDSVSGRYKFLKEVYYDTSNIDSIASVAYYKSFIENLKLLNHFDTVINLGYRYPDVGKDKISMLLPDKCDSIRNAENIDIILSLNQFALADMNKLSRFDYNSIIRMNVRSEAVWSLYDLTENGQIQTLLKRDSTMFESTSVSKKGIEKAKKDRVHALNEASEDFGAEFAKFVTPHWIDVKRLYYRSGILKFMQAEKLIKDGNWIDAAKIWKEFANHKSKNIRAKSMFNLGIACEMEGSIDAALDWVIKSFYIFQQKDPIHSQHCLSYVNILNQRNLDIKNLKKQYGDL